MPTPQPKKNAPVFAELISRSQFEFLARERHQACVSIFLPTPRAFPDAKQGPIFLKDLLRQAESDLTAMGLPPLKIREMLQPARDLIEREGFWTGSDGLAVFLAPSFFQYFRLPVRFDPLSTVTDRFEMSPLIPLFAADGRFYVLAFSHNLVRLIEGTPYASTELPLPRVPRSAAELEASEGEVRQSIRQVHSGGPLGHAAGKREAVFTGQGTGVDDKKTITLEFIYAIERGVRSALRAGESMRGGEPGSPDRAGAARAGVREPLILAAVEELQAMYQQVNRYPVLLPQGIHGNPDLARPEDLRAAGWKIASAFFDQDCRRALESFNDLKAAGRASSDLHQVLLAAYQGRVQAAFIEANAHQWGNYDFDDDVLEVHETRAPADEDLLNLAAIRTIVDRGIVYQLPREQMPGGAALAATFRY